MTGRSRASPAIARVLAVFVAACSARPGGDRTPATTTCPPATNGDATSVVAGDSVASLRDAWLGELTIGGRRQRYLRVDFTDGTTRLRPELNEAPLALLHAARSGDRIRFGIDTGRTRLAFEGTRVAPDTIEGEVHADAERGPFRLVHIATIDPAAVDRAAAGTYAVDGDPRRLWFVADGVMFDTSDGSERRLFGRDDGRLLIGAGKSTAFPAAGTIEVAVDAAGRSRLIAHRADGTTSTATKIALAAEEVSFERDGAVLEGTLLLPPGSGPWPAVVNVHGSGRVTRDDFWTRAVARIFIAQGYAVLAYDKRGSGASGGEYVGRGARETNNVSPENLERLAADARAAVAAIASRPAIDPKHIGLFGISQAGWIVPLAAAHSEAVSFVVLFSGPTVHSSLEGAHSALFADGEVDTKLTLEAVDRYVHDVAPRTGFDPSSSIAALRVPALWMFGALDRSIPVAESVRVLDRIGSKGKHDFTVKVFPHAGHLLYEVDEDLASELPYSAGMAAGEAEFLRSWLRQHVAQRPP